MRERFSLAVVWCAAAAPAFAQPDPPAAQGVADPPTPVVRIQVRVPSTIAPGKDVPYKLTVTNTSTATAYQVVVRNPLPAGATVVKVEPPADNYDPKKPPVALPKELTWKLGRLPAGDKREIEFTLKPAADAKELPSQAFVAFEHGQSVLTKVDRPKLAVKKVAPKQAAQTDAIPVRVEVTNGGRVSVTNVELVEDVSKGFEFSDGAEGERGNTPQQRVWKLGTLRPGERKVVEYRLTAKDVRSATDLLTTSAVRGTESPEGDRAEATTRVLVSGVTLELTGPTGVAAGETAAYEIVVRNTGTLSLADLKVTGAFPADCTLVNVTNNAQRYRDSVSWACPALKPGEAFAFRFKLKAGTTGKRTVRAAATDGRGLERTRELVTTFSGAAVPQWTATLDPPLLEKGRNGLLTVVVRNGGSEAARNVRLRVTLPEQVRFEQGSPKHRASPTEVEFDAVTVPAGAEEKFTLTYRADRLGQAVFELKLTADALGEQPLVTTKSVEITAAR